VRHLCLSILSQSQPKSAGLKVVEVKLVAFVSRGGGEGELQAVFTDLAGAEQSAGTECGSLR
jgi:hypothetical protein